MNHIPTTNLSNKSIYLCNTIFHYFYLFPSSCIWIDIYVMHLLSQEIEQNLTLDHAKPCIFIGYPYGIQVI